MTAPAKSLQQYQNDPRLFVREILGVTTNYPKQDAILCSIRDNPRTAVRAGNGCGKTVAAAQAVLWATCCFLDCLVITTAASNRQVRQQLWAEIGNLHRRARRPLGGELLGTQLRFRRTGSRAIGFSTDDAGRFEGWHAKRILVVIDEAKSVSQEIFDAVERLLSAGVWVRLLVISTPGGPVGPFYDIFAKQTHLYCCHHISAYDSPFICPEWIEERKLQWGESSPLFQSAVMGEFPTASQDGVVIQLAHLERLLADPPEPMSWELYAGIDLAAGGGDETVVAIFRGNHQIAMKSWREADTMVTVGRILDFIRPFNVPHTNVNIDADGLGGPIIDRFRELGYGFTAIHNGGEPQDKKQFVNLSAELWAIAAQKIERREVALFPDSTLMAQLTSRRLKPRSDGRFQLESKEDMRRRGLPSPDRADATILALAGNRFAGKVPNLEFVTTDSPSNPQEEADEKLRQWYRLVEAEVEKVRNGEPALSGEAIRDRVFGKKA